MTLLLILDVCLWCLLAPPTGALTTTTWHSVAVPGFASPFRVLEGNEKRVGDITWPGGRGLASYLASNDGLVRGKTVFDLGAGNGIASLACLELGAKHVVALDVDEDALNRLNEASDGNVETRVFDFVEGELPDDDADVLIAADVCYTEAMASHLARQARRALDRGNVVVVADSQRWRWQTFLDDLFKLAEEKDLSDYHLDQLHVQASRRMQVNILLARPPSSERATLSGSRSR